MSDFEGDADDDPDPIEPPEDWAPTPGPNPPPGGRPPGQGPPPYYGQPGPYGGAYAPGVGSTNSQAGLALALSVCGLLMTIVLGLCCGPFGLAGLLLCGLGIYLGTTELSAIDAGQADPSGRGLAKGAQVIGGVGIGLFLLAIAVGSVMLAVRAAV